MKIETAKRGVLGKSFRFSVLSIVSFAATIGLTIVSVEVLGIDPLPAHVITLVIVFLLNFAGLTYFVFPGHTDRLFRTFLSFLASTFGFRVLEWIVFALLVTLAAMDYRIAIIVVVPFFTALKFLFLNHFTFARRSVLGDTPK